MAEGRHLMLILIDRQMESVKPHYLITYFHIYLFIFDYDIFGPQ